MAKKKDTRMRCARCGKLLWATISAEGVKIWCTEHGVVFTYTVVFGPRKVLAAQKKDRDG